MKYFPGSAKGIITTFRSKHFNISYSYSMNYFVCKGLFRYITFQNFLYISLTFLAEFIFCVSMLTDLYPVPQHKRCCYKDKTDEKEMLAQFPKSNHGKSNIREVVGFSHNPFSTSVPQEENLEGRRETLRIGRY